MALTVDAEQLVQADINRLREQFSDTKELYREVCALLFFRHGITPTSNLLYQFVRRGTMSTVAGVLRKFWSDLREKSHHRISHPDLPVELNEVAGGLIAAVWEKANLLAAQGLEVFKTEAEQAVAAARQEVATVTQERDSVRLELAQAQERIAQETKKVEAVEREKAALQATITALEKQTEEQASALRAAKADQEAARKDFAAEIEKMRADLTLAEDRREKDHTRMLLEIEKERQTTKGLQEELETARKHNRTSDESWRAAIEKAHRSLGDAREKNGALEGKLHSVEASLTTANAEVLSLREQVTELKVRLAGRRTGDHEEAELDEEASATSPARRKKTARA